MARWVYLGGAAVMAAALLAGVLAMSNATPAPGNLNLAMLPLGDGVRKEWLGGELTRHNAHISDAAVRTYKYEAMSASPFTFYRATAHLYYEDIDQGVIAIPASWVKTKGIETWISGDLHTQNFGYFENDEGEVVFGINDYDEAYMAPFYWDLIRFCASVHLMRDEVGFEMSKNDAEEVAQTFLEHYQSTLEKIKGNDDETTWEITHKNASGFVDARMEKIKKEYTTERLLQKWTIKDGAARRFDPSSVELEMLDSSFKGALQEAWSHYVAQVGGAFAQSHYFDLKDAARRLKSGLGSQGMQKLYVLIQGESASLEDDVLLELKEQTLPALFYVDSMDEARYGGSFPSHPIRVLTATKAMLNNAEEHLGVLELEGKAMTIKRISPYKYSLDAADFKSKSDLKNYAQHCGISAALSHARADKDYKNGAFISGSFEKAALDAIAAWPRAKSTIAELGERYANQVVKDHQLFLSLLAAREL